MTFLESLQGYSTEIITAAVSIVETAPYFENSNLFVESADSILGQLAAKLRANAMLNPQEVDEFAILYTSLSLLADPNVRAGFNIDLTQPNGQAKFKTILNDTGENPAVTREVGKVATVTGKGRLEKMKNDLRNYPTMKPMDQQLFVNQINKLRIAFERAKQQLAQKNLPMPDAQKILPI